MKKILAIVILVLLGVGLYFIFFNGPDVEEVIEIDQPVSKKVIKKPKEVVKKAEVPPTTVSKLKEKTKPKKHNEIQNTDDLQNEILKLSELNREEVSECERNIDDAIGLSTGEGGDQFFLDENQVAQSLEEFDRLNLNVSSQTKIMKLLAHEHADGIQADWIADNLKDLRPCKPFVKVNYINNLAAGIVNNDWSDEVKLKAKGAIFNYMRKELTEDSNLLLLGMQLSLLESFVDEGFIPSSEEDSIIGLLDELEDEKDKIVEQAMAHRESENNQGRIPVDIIRKEFELSKKYRPKMVKLIDTMEQKAK